MSHWKLGTHETPHAYIGHVYHGLRAFVFQAHGLCACGHFDEVEADYSALAGRGGWGSQETVRLAPG